MNSSQGALHFQATLDYTQLRQGIDAIRRDIMGLNNSVQQQTSSMQGAFKNLAIGIGSYFSAQALMGFTQQLINVRGEFQKTEIAFGTMLGSRDKAAQLMGEMVNLAAKTPFSLQEVSAGAKQLLAFQVPAKEVVETLRRMGDIAAGLGVPLERINLVYGQVKAKGRLMGDDLRQFTEAGIPMVHELAKSFNVSDSAITKMVSDGKIGFADVQKVLFNLTNEGGMFYNLMEAQSKSLSGQVSNLGDAWDQMLNKIGQSNEGILSDGIQGITYLIEHYQEVGRALLTLVEIYGAYRAALILTSVAQSATVAPAIIQGFQNLAAVLKGAVVEQEALNAASIANPYVLIATAIVSLGVVIYNYRQELGELLGITEKATEAMKFQEEVDSQLTNSFSQGVVEKTAKIQQLRAVFESENSTLEQRKSAYNQLIAIDSAFRGTLDGQYRSTNKLGEAFDLVVKKMQAFALAQAQMAAIKVQLENYAKAEFNNAIAKVKYKDAEAQTKQLTALYNSGKITRDEYFSGMMKFSGTAQELQKTTKEFLAQKNAMQTATKAQKEIIGGYDKIINRADKLENRGWTMDSGKKYSAKAIADMKREREVARAAMGAVNTVPDATIPTTSTAVEKDTKELKKAKDKHKKELEKIYGADTLKGMQQRMQKFREIMETSPVGGEKYNNAKSQAEFYQKRINEISKNVQKKSFDDELAELERQWKVKYLLAKEYGQEIANAQFPNLKGSYYDDIANKSEVFSKKIESGAKLTDDEIQQWEKLKNILRSLTGEKDPISNFNDNIDKQLAKLPTLTQQIEYLTNLRDKQDNSGVSQGFYAAADGRLQAKLAEQKQVYQQILQEQQSYEEKSLKLQKDYEEAKKLAKNDDDRKKVDNAYKKKLGELDAEMIKSTAEWQVAFGELEGMTNSSLQIILQRLLDFQSKTKGTLSLQDSAELQRAIDNVNNAANRNPFQKLIYNFSNYRTALIELKKAQEDHNRVLSENPNDANKVDKSGEDMVEADKRALKAKKALVAQLDNIQTIFNEVGQGIKDIGDLFGGLDDATSDALDNILSIGNAAFDLGKSITTGNIGGIIKSGIKLIGSISKALSGDQKKERNIKQQAEALKELEVAYNRLAFAAEKAIGAQKYEGQRVLIRNLEQQRIAIENMRNSESSKKKSDSNKIAEYNSQIEQINQNIVNIKEGIIKDVLQTDIPNMASKMGDALLDAFGKGEDGVRAINAAFDDMVKNIMRNQLNLILQKQLEPVYDNILKAAGFNKDGSGVFDGFTQSELDDLRNQVQGAMQQGQSFIEAYKEIFNGLDVSSNSVQGIKGDIKAVSEKTAGALEAQINAMRINQVAGLEATRNILIQLPQIESNTRKLHSIDKNIQELNQKTKPGLAGL